MRQWRAWQSVLLVLLLTACAEVPEQPASSPAPAEPPPAVEKERPLAAQPLKYLANRKLAPLPTRALNIKSTCSTRDAIGTRTRLQLLVKNAEVKQFSAQVDIPKRGLCSFDLKNFTQKETLPQVLLAARDGSDCTVRMWEQGPRTTIAFNHCPAACAGEAFDYLWPILVDTRSGRCF